MSLPSEYVIEDAVRSIDDVIVYRASHPIHGTVNVYLPDDSLPRQLAGEVNRRLYQSGLQMRNVSLMDVACVTKALEVSQNPNEPYIVTADTKHDLDEFISNGVIIKPGRMFAILKQILEAIVSLASNGWATGRFHPRQVKLSQAHTGDISFNVIEGAEQQADIVEATASTADIVPGARDEVTKKAGLGGAFAPTVSSTQAIDETQALKSPRRASAEENNVDRTATLDEGAQIKDAQKLLRTRQRNIYLLGSVSYQLLFGRSYQSNDKVATANIKGLGRRWRKILQRALYQDIDGRYESYEGMLADVKRAVNRNKRMAVASIPFLLLLLAVGSYFAYERYHRHRIMTSEAGQAIKTFLDIVNKTDDEITELQKPQPPAPIPDEQAILRPFDKIEAPE